MQFSLTNERLLAQAAREHDLNINKMSFMILIRTDTTFLRQLFLWVLPFVSNSKNIWIEWSEKNGYYVFVFHSRSVLSVLPTPYRNLIWSDKCRE